MNRIFEPSVFVSVPDGTEVSPYLNATGGAAAGLAPDSLGDMSIAAGRIAAGQRSWIHRHPAVNQVTQVLSGELCIWMREPHQREPYSLRLRSGQAAVCEAGTLLQLHNPGTRTARVLYIVSPSYVFEQADGKTLYDEALLVAPDWATLASMPDDHPALRIDRDEQLARRATALRRLQERARRGR
ncbi:MAG: cupin domain-containing protein [Gammaproteobacteria bacterium]|nr:cupin domain-containing protein [Gammaproteobacteria bacterium]